MILKNNLYKSIKNPLWMISIIKFKIIERFVAFRICKIFKNKKGIRIGGRLIFDNCLLIDNITDVNIARRFLGEKNKVDYLTDAPNLYFSKDNEFDFVASSHVLEHIANPIKAIYEWKRVLKKGGFIYCGVPDKRFTFDHKRNRTSLDHLIDDYKNNVNQKDKTHLIDFINNYDVTMDVVWNNKKEALDHI